ncbi:MAG: ribosome-associated translation inhibitor RaiA [Spirochaetales bacterium]|nr:ribosome-associated translation inhibitor RaiA [Spirochaetales bacterium]
MNVDIKGVHYDISDNTRRHVDKKLKRLSYAEGDIVDLLITITHDKNGYTVESTVNFKWGKSAHIKVDSFDLFQAIDNLFNKLDNKVSKEKEKIQEH